MNMRNIPKWDLADKTGAAVRAPRAITRRQFVRRAAGAGLAGAALAAACGNPALARDHGSTAPVPIPGGTPAVGGGFHFFGPTPDGSFDPINAEPSTITDFNGFIGLAYVDVMVTRRNHATGEVRRLPSIFSDMRFMLGEYRGEDGKLHHGAFALV
jgi:hypothetical protein